MKAKIIQVLCQIHHPAAIMLRSIIMLQPDSEVEKFAGLFIRVLRILERDAEGLRILQELGIDETVRHIIR